MSPDGRVFDPTGQHPITQLLEGTVVGIDTSRTPRALTLYYQEGRRVLLWAEDDELKVAEDRLPRA